MKRILLIAFLCAPVLLTTFPLNTVSAENSAISIKHGERSFTFANGTYLYGELKYYVDAVFKIYES